MSHVNEFSLMETHCLPRWPNTLESPFTYAFLTPVGTVCQNLVTLSLNRIFSRIEYFILEQIFYISLSGFWTRLRANSCYKAGGKERVGRSKERRHQLLRKLLQT